MGYSVRNLIKFLCFASCFFLALFVFGRASTPDANVLAAPAQDYVYYFPIVQKTGWTGTWEQIGFADGDVTDIQITLDDVQHLYASVYLQGLYETVDGGSTWLHHDVRARIHEIEVSPATNKTMYLATFSIDGVYRTLDGGLYWEPLPNSPSSLNLLTLSIHPTKPDVLLVGGHQWEYGWGILFKTIDNGETWHSTTGFTPLDIAFNPVSSNVVYVGASHGVMKSIDEGETWLFASDGLPVDNPYDVYEIIFHPDDPDHLYAATETGVYTSFDAAVSWEPLLTGDETRSIVFHPLDSATLFAGTDNGIYVSHNNGVNWYPLAGCIDNVRFNSLVFDLTEPDLLWAGTSDGLWKCQIDGVVQ